MHDLYLLSESLSLCAGPIDDFQSLIWTEKYYECGEYTLTLPMKPALFAATRDAAYVWVPVRRRLGRIEKIIASDTDGTDILVLSGRMAESLLSDRVIPRGTAVSGALCAAIETLVENNAGPAAGDRAIAHLTVAAGVSLVDADGAELQLDDNPGGQQLDVWLYETLSAVGATYRITPDFDTGVLVFSIFRGLDRTQAQTETPYAVFSTSFASVGALEFLSDKSDHKNFAYIAGEGEGEDRVMVTLDLRESADEPLRELYVDARDLRSDDGGTQMSAEAYRNLLLTRGKQRLASHKAIVRLSGTAASYAADSADEAGALAPTWGEDIPPVGASLPAVMQADVHYALGDLVDIACETFHMTWSERITEITYVCEGTMVRVETRFGDAYPDLRTYIRTCAEECTSIHN